MKTKRHYLVFLALFVFIAVGGSLALRNSNAAEVPIPITPDDQIGWRLEKGFLSAREIIEISGEAGFFQPFEQALKKTNPPGSGEYWIRLPLTNLGSEAVHYVLEVEYPWIASAYLYRIENGILETSKTGEFARADEFMNYGSDAFRISLEPGESRTYFLFFNNQYQIHPNLRMWEDTRAFVQKTTTQGKFIFAYLGLMLGLFVTNCCVYFVFRYRDLVFYLVYLFSVGLLQGVNFQLHYPLLRWLTPNDNYILEMKVDYFGFGGLLFLSAGFLILFANEFLHFSKLAPRLHRWLHVFGCASLVCAPLILFGPGRLLGPFINEVVALILLGSHLIALCMGIYAAYRKLPQAGYFIPPLLLLVIVSARFSWMTFSGSAISSNLLNQWLLASCLEMIALTYALVERFLEENQKKEQAQAQAMERVQKFADLNSRYNKDLNKEVESRTAALKQSNDQKDELLRIIAHDLKSPVDSMVKLTEQLADTAADPHKQRLALQIGSNAANVAELMKNLLEWAQMRTMQQEIQPQPFLLLDLFEATIASVTPQAKMKNIRIDAEIDEALYADFDFDCIAVVLRNLVSNAIKFSDEHSRIVLRGVEEPERVRVEVQDWGRGIEAERLQALNTGANVKSEAGTKGEAGNGIGLQICRNVLIGHKSKLILQSVPGEGTVGAFWLKTWKQPHEYRSPPPY